MRDRTVLSASILHKRPREETLSNVVRIWPERIHNSFARASRASARRSCTSAAATTSSGSSRTDRCSLRKPCCSLSPLNTRLSASRTVRPGGGRVACQCLHTRISRCRSSRLKKPPMTCIRPGLPSSTCSCASEAHGDRGSFDPSHSSRAARACSSCSRARRMSAVSERMPHAAARRMASSSTPVETHTGSASAEALQGIGASCESAPEAPALAVGSDGH
eukprot:4002456-Prymnesium_polylepis.1